jgi:predicted patatin/cPLA2 family phospholipase
MTLKLLLLVLGGGMRGPYSAGQGLALQKMGFRKSFNTVVGISAGAGIAAYFVAGEEQGLKGTSIFYEEATNDLISYRPKRLLTQLLNSDVITDAMREGPKKLDQQAILDSPTDLYVAVTRQENKQAELINVKVPKQNRIEINAIGASMDVPLIRGKGKEVNGVRYIDGGFDPLPLKEIIDKFHPTDILVLPNVPFDKLETFKASSGMEWIAENLTESGSPGAIKKFLKITEALRGLLEEFKEENDVNIGILWPPDGSLESTTTEPQKIKASIYQSARDAFGQFGAEAPSLELFESIK